MPPSQTASSQSSLTQSSLTQRLLTIYRRLLDRYGPQHWWPAETPFEMIVGAILTQAVTWKNVERAIANLKAAGVLSPEAIHALSEEELAELIRPAGYFNAKARKLKAFVAALMERRQGDLDAFFAQELPRLRAELLAIHGIGPETADAILLYAAHKPIFMIDAYTVRLFTRLGLAREGVRYQELQRLFMENLPPDVSLFQEYHALIVAHAKETCRKRQPRCPACPLLDLCPYGQAQG